VKGTEFDVPPPGAGLNTVTLAVPAAAMSVAGIVAVSWVLLTKVVVRFALFHLTREPTAPFTGTKPEPLTVRVKDGPPARAEFGVIFVIVGTGFPCPRATSPEPRKTSPMSASRAILPSIDLCRYLVSFMIASP
jgi:hypothetical protein